MGASSLCLRGGPFPVVRRPVVDAAQPPAGDGEDETEPEHREAEGEPGQGIRREERERGRGHDQEARHERGSRRAWLAYGALGAVSVYCHFFAGDYLKNTGPSDGANFGYTMATINF